MNKNDIYAKIRRTLSKVRRIDFIWVLNIFKSQTDAHIF